MLQLIEIESAKRKMIDKAAEQYKEKKEEIIPTSINEILKHRHMRRYLKEEWPAYLKSKGYVPSQIYVFVDDKEEKVLGFIEIRLDMTQDLLLFGGAMEYSIVPDERNKGYGTLMLKMALEKCKKFNMDEVLIICKEGNKKSEAVIKNNNGILENVITVNGITYKRYWIECEY